MGIQPRVLYILGKHSTNGPYLRNLFLTLKGIVSNYPHWPKTYSIAQKNLNLQSTWLCLLSSGITGLWNYSKSRF